MTRRPFIPARLPTVPIQKRQARAILGGISVTLSCASPCLPITRDDEARILAWEVKTCRAQSLPPSYALHQRRSKAAWQGTLLRPLHPARPSYHTSALSTALPSILEDSVRIRGRILIFTFYNFFPPSRTRMRKEILVSVSRKQETGMRIRGFGNVGSRILESSFLQFLVIKALRLS